MQDDKDDKKLNNQMYDEEYEENDDSENEEDDDSGEESGAGGSFGASPLGGGKSSPLKGLSGFAGKASKTIKKIAKVVALLPLPVKIALIAILMSIFTFIVMELMKDKSTKSVTSSVNNTISDMQEKLESGTLSDEEKEKVQKAIDYFNENNSYLYFTISDINDAYTNFVTSYKDSTNDVDSKTYASLSKIYGEDELFETNDDGTIDSTRGSSRIVHNDDKQSLFQHMLMTEKYNFNKTKWKWYGHGHDGESLTATADSSGTVRGGFSLDKELGLRYPKDDYNKGLKLEDFISMLSPYMQTWHIPLAFHSAFLTMSGSSDAASKFVYSVIKNTYSNIIVNRYDLQNCIENTYFKDYIEAVYKSRVQADIKLTVTYEAQTKDDSPSRSANITRTTSLPDLDTKNLFEKEFGKSSAYIKDMSVYGTSGSTKGSVYDNAVEVHTTLSEFKNTVQKYYVESFLPTIKDSITSASDKALHLQWQGTAGSTLSKCTSGGTYYSVEVTFEATKISGMYKVNLKRHTLHLTIMDKRNYERDSSGRIIWNKYYQYEYINRSVLEAEKVEEYYVNERAKDDSLVKQDILNKGLTKDPIPEIDRKKEVRENLYIDITPTYYVVSAEMFDLKIANKYNYIKYNDDDVTNRVNFVYEKEILREDYHNVIDGENEITTGSLAKYIGENTTLREILNNGLEIEYSAFRNNYSDAYNRLIDTKPKTKLFVDTTTIVPSIATKDVGTTEESYAGSMTLTKKTDDTNPYNVATFGSEREVEYIYKSVYKNTKTFIKQDGVIDGENKRGIHHIERYWEDNLTPMSSEEKLYTVSDLEEFNVDHNENSEVSENEAREAFKKLETKCPKSYEEYQLLETNEVLNNIDMLNSNKSIFSEYMVDKASQSSITGYSRAWLEMGLDELKKLFEKTVAENRRCSV